MKSNFSGPSFTLGVEEELMILDEEAYGLVSAVEALIDESDEGDIKPELLESVLEISTQPCRDAPQARAQLRALRDQVRDKAAERGLCIGSAGTHPFAMWEDQRVSAHQRYRDLISDLRFVARQEIIFGLHVHVGIEGAEKAIHVANGMRVHIPILLALSANSPFWRGDATGMASSRMPIFRAFPRVGVPPYYDGWADYERSIEFMVEAGIIKDYTYLWYDIRPHPDLGTIEVRAMDAQTRLEHTVALAALIQAMVHELAAHFDSGGRLETSPYELLDENRWFAARDGMEGELVDLPSAARVSSKDLARRLHARLREHAEELGAAAEFDAILDVVDHGNGAQRQRVVYEANHDFRELVRDIVAATHAP